MEFRRSGQRDDRRRRVLREEVMREATHRASGDTGPVARDYSRAARRVAQPRVVDSIPKRAWLVWLLAVTLLAVGVGCGLLEYYLAPLAGDSRIAAHFLPSAPGGVDQWLATCLLLVSSWVAYQIWSMRRFKSNDYRGAYQVWLWISCVMLLASLEVNANFRVFIDEYLTGKLHWARPTEFIAWSQVVLVACGLLLLIRMVLEYRRSRAALLTILGAGFCFAGRFAFEDASSLLSEFGVGDGLENAAAPLIGLSLCASALVLISLWSYARFVFLEVHGLLKQVDQRRSPRVVRRRARHIRLLRAKREKREALAAEAAAEVAAQSHRDWEDESTDEQPVRESRRRPSKSVPAAKAERPKLKVTAEPEQEHDEESSASRRRGSKKTTRNRTGTESTTGKSSRKVAPSSASEEPHELSIAAGTESAGTEAADSTSPESSSGMSKAERRRLRKLARRSERRAA